MQNSSQNTLDAVVLQKKTAPEPDGKSLLGHVREIKRDHLGAYLRWHRTYGDVVGFRLGPKRFYLVSHPKLAEEMLITQQNTFVKPFNPDKPSGLPLVVGNGLLTSSGKWWKRQRQLIQPSFHRSHIVAMGPVINNVVSELIGEWKNRDPEQPLDVNAEMMRITLEIISIVICGAGAQDIAARVGSALHITLGYVQKNSYNPIAPPLFIPTKANREFKQAMAVLADTVNVMVEKRKQDGTRPDDLLDVLLNTVDKETGEGISRKQLIDEVVSLFVAGHEATANALSWAWYQLAKNPEIFNTLRKEVDSVLQGRPPVTADLPNLVYTRAILDETLRLYPTIPQIVRGVANDTHLNGFKISKGAIVLLNVRNLQRHPDIWPNPDTFDPTRFLPEQSAKIPRMAFMPFGAGPRVCVGNHLALTEGTLVLAQIAQSFDLALAEGSRVEEEIAISLRPKYGLQMYVKQRKS
jgi:cytochrome P450